MSRACLICVAIGLAAPVSRAQAPADGLTGILRLGTMGPQTPITVVMAPAVQEELKLSQAQKTKVYDLALAAEQKRRDLFQAMAFSGGANPQAMLAARDDLRRENERAVGRILDARQQERLDQIVLQVEGPLAVSRPDVAARLRLNDTQLESIRMVMLQLQQGQRELYIAARRQAVTFSQLDPGRFAQAREAMASLRDGAVKKIGEFLDRKQKANFNKLLGPPFDLAKLDPEGEPKATATTTSESEKTDAKDQAKGTPGSDKEGPKSSARPTRRKTRPRTRSHSNPSPSPSSGPGANPDR